MTPRRVASCLLTGLALVTAVSAHADTRPSLDLSSAAQPTRAAMVSRLSRLSADPALARVGTVKHVDERYGVPNLVVAPAGASVTKGNVARAASPGDAARDHLLQLAPYYRLDAADVASARLRYLNDTGEGGIVAAFDQSFDGVPVFREEIKVLMDRSLGLIAVSGHVPGREEAGSAEARAFAMESNVAVAHALGDMSGTTVDRGAVRVRGTMEGGYETFDVSGAGVPAGLGASAPIRARRVLFHMADTLVPAYYVELFAADEALAYVVAADDGRVLLRHDLVDDDSFTYRVWADNTALHAPYDGPQGNGPTPHPTGMPDNYSPPFTATSLQTLQNGAISTNDPWLAPGATTTTGNNVDAYADLVAPDGFSAGDLRATTTSANTFDRTYDPNLNPDVNATQQMAAVTQLFYLNNFLHDWFYDSGFNEAAGNAQSSNFGRGGVAGDRLLVEAQDYSGNNNANMLTPADGVSPREQMFNYLPATGPLSQVTVNAPASIAGAKACVGANTNPATVNLTAPVALPTSGTFSVQFTSPVQTSPGAEWVNVADLDGDGRLDLASANFGNNMVSVLINAGSGSFPNVVNYPTGAGPYVVITPDLNNDGRPDMVTANFTASSISVRLGTGGGAFGAKTDIVVATNPACVASGRLNADAFDDLVIANYGAGTVSVLLGNGAGGFGAKTDYFMGANPNWVAVGDLNNDGKADVVTANAGSNTVSVRLGLGTGVLDTQFISTCGNGPLTLALGDLNGDGRLDAVTANGSANTIAVLLGQGNGFFNAPTPYTVPGTPVTVTLGHLNEDGILDVAVCSDAANSVSVLMGNGAGGLGSPTSFTTGMSPYGVQIGDVNGDLIPDLVSADYLGNSMTLLIGQGGPPLPACPPFTNTLTGRIALIFGGTCSAYDKIHAAELAGAAAVIIFDGAGTGPLTVSPAVGIPAFLISATDGNGIRGALRTGGVTATVSVTTPVTRPSAIDGQTAAHEWGHHMSNRLIGNASGLTNLQGAGMGEGWSDFVDLLLIVKPEDAAAAANANWTGVFAHSGYVRANVLFPNNAYYFGPRRYPYSTDFAKDPLTFKHIQDGIALPAGPPQNSNGYSNAEVHNSGEVWCTALWECYASLLRATGRMTFTQARDRMRRYLVQSLMLTPDTPTFLEARDAMLLAAYSTDLADYNDFRAAFARRGMGTDAVAPDRFDPYNEVVTESFVLGGDLEFVSATFFDEIHSCDIDGYLDAGEVGLLTVTLSNPLSSNSNMTQTTATVTSTNPNVSFPQGNTMIFPASTPGGTTKAKLRVTTSGPGLQVQDLTVAYNDPGLLHPGPRTVALPLMWGNADEAAASSDNVEERTPVWTFEGPRLSASSVAWSRVQTSATNINHYFFVPDADSLSDRWLVSPSIAVGAGPFGFTFKHAHAFEGTGPNYYDGGVVEISANGGVSWTDIGASISPGYGGTIAAGYANPLAGRPAFVGTSPGFPTFAIATASLGTTYANQTVKLRFRIGTDYADGAAGWGVDSLTFTGITNQPFVTLVAEPASCAPVGAEERMPTELSFAIAGANPTAGDPVLRFELPKATRVRIDIYDVVGRRVATLADGEYAAGIHTARWATGSHGTADGPGVYFARMTTGNQVLGRRLVILAR